MKELLELLIEQVKSDQNFLGMCACIQDLYLEHKVTRKEEILLGDFIVLNRGEIPVAFSGYWWGYNEKQPRIDFLKGLIKNI